MLRPLITAAELTELLGHKKSKNDLIIIDCRFSLNDFNMGSQVYKDGHIMGAHYLHLNEDLSSPELEHGGRHPLPRPNRFTSTMQNCGVSSHSHVVIYDDQHFGFAARCWWLLRYFGHDNVQILDGGYSDWVAQGGQTSTVSASNDQGDFIANPHAHWTIDHPSIEHSLDCPSRILVDSREATRYQGIEEPIDSIAGHIPGAANFPWQEVTDEQGYALPPAQQQQRWLSLPKDKEIVVYCGSGITACVNLLSLELAGIKGAKLYPGSWSDWCSYLKAAV